MTSHRTVFVHAYAMPRAPGGPRPGGAIRIGISAIFYAAMTLSCAADASRTEPTTTPSARAETSRAAPERLARRDAQADEPQKIVVNIGDGAQPLSKVLEIAAGAPLRAVIRNAHDREIFLPAAPSACALISIEMRRSGSWERWSNCDMSRRIDNPLTLAPGAEVSGEWRGWRRGGLPLTAAEKSRGMPQSEGDDPAKPPMIREVPQLTIDTPPVPFFERFRTLPANEYRLTTSYALSEAPREIQYAHSPPFAVVN